MNKENMATNQSEKPNREDTIARLRKEHALQVKSLKEETQSKLKEMEERHFQQIQKLKQQWHSLIAQKDNYIQLLESLVANRNHETDQLTFKATELVRHQRPFETKSFQIKPKKQLPNHTSHSFEKSRIAFQRNRMCLPTHNHKHIPLKQKDEGQFYSQELGCQQNNSAIDNSRASSRHKIPCARKPSLLEWKKAPKIMR